MKKILVLFGTRPECIKMAPVVWELRKYPDLFETVVCSTGQHREMLKPLLKAFELESERPLDFDLDLMEPNQNLSKITSKMLLAIDQVVGDVKPDWILAQGDTTTVLVASIVAYYHRINFGHVEAGLRTYDKFRPFPEEINRRMADAASDAFFAPTEDSRLALLRENIDASKIVVSGNTVIDTLFWALSRVEEMVSGQFRKFWVSLPTTSKKVLVTAHRRESFGGPFEDICLSLRDLAREFPERRFVYPVHLNPNVQGPVNRILRDLPNVHLIEPLDYFDFVYAMMGSELILTDSGGVQEEAPSLRVPVLVMRDTTERPEGVAAGVVRLIGVRREGIVSAASDVLRNTNGVLDRMRIGASPYGDGQAAKKIVGFLKAHH
jgi:UDP-N-acetylglucosamine 2-epimerase (non-hydrolysing)